MEPTNLQKIKSRMYWRINIQPNSIDNLSLKEAFKKVEEASINLRGWDYPHIHKRNNNAEGGNNNCGTFFQSWCDWHNHIEFWRMYQSSQYLHYLSLREAWREVSRNNAYQKDYYPEKYISVTGSLWTITEIMKFCFSLHKLGLYKNGCNIFISLINCSDSELFINDPNKLGFSTPKTNSAETLELEKMLSASQIQVYDNKIALDLTQQLFEKFGWEGNRPQMEADQKKLLDRLF